MLCKTPTAMAGATVPETGVLDLGSVGDLMVTLVGQVLHEVASDASLGAKWQLLQLFGKICLLGFFSFTSPAATKLSARREHFLNPPCHNIPTSWAEFGGKSSQTA
jgi:hypothetical protein